MMVPGNYSTRAIESIRSHLMKITDQQQRDELLRIESWLHQSVKFVLPEGGRFFNTKTNPTRQESELLHFPFPVVALEYAVPGDSKISWHPDSVDTFIARKRICLCVDFSPEQASEFPYTLAAHPEVAEDGGIAIIALWQAEHLSAWSIAPFACVVSRRQEATPHGELPVEFSDSVSEKEKHNLLSFSFEVLLSEIAARLYGQVGEDAQRIAYGDMIDEINTALSFIQVMACSNVGTEIIPASKKLNRKRAKKGQLPFNDYHVLSVQTGHRASGSRESSNTPTDRHSPRQHLRRGHIRRLADGRRIWVNPCVVAAGSSSVVAKDYRVVG